MIPFKLQIDKFLVAISGGFLVQRLIKTSMAHNIDQ